MIAQRERLGQVAGLRFEAAEMGDPGGIVQAVEPDFSRRTIIAIAQDRLREIGRDDGIGGADPEGRGLTGIRRRVEALDGTLDVTSPPLGPTTIEAVLPCGS